MKFKERCIREDEDGVRLVFPKEEEIEDILNLSDLSIEDDVLPDLADLSVDEDKDQEEEFEEEEYRAKDPVKKFQLEGHDRSSTLNNKFPEETFEDTTLKDLSHFQNFIRNNFKDHPQYKKMMPDQHQPARLYGTAKTHKFDSYDEITTDNIKLRPIMDQQGTMVYNASQVIADYLRPLAENKYIIKDSLSFPTFLSENKLNEDEEDVSYDVESLSTNVPVDDTIEYIIIMA